MKYIFFDIDGTLTYDKNGQSYIPTSTKQTIQKLQEQGHMVAVAEREEVIIIFKK